MVYYRQLVKTNLKGAAMSEALLIDNASPTLAGLKTGNLFACPAEDIGSLRESLRRLNRVLVPRGVRILPVRYLEERILIYLYRPARLRKDLSNGVAKEILTSRGYPAEDSERCVAELMRRLRADGSFPHEVGLFLGYPSEDVSGFITNGAKGAKCVGTWKVYGDEAAAQKKFALYRKCTRVYREAYGRHRSLSRLTVRAH